MKSVFLFALIIVCSFSFSIYAQQISITDAESIFIDDDYIIVGTTHSVPPRLLKKKEGYIYQIDLTIDVSGDNFIWSSPLNCIFTFPDGKQVSKVINIESYTLFSHEKHHFTFNIRTKRKGQAKIDISPFYRCGTNLPDDSNIKFSGNYILLE